LSYEDSEAAHSDDEIGIPESGNGTPDILDEARYELEWMLKMQDETSGGVYHKVTGEVFPETVLAVEETAQMILSPISNTATGDFAAVMAKASVLYRDFDADFADECLAAAEKAWDYLSAHKGDSGFKNVGDIVTGEYPDSKDADEYLWAAVELYLATGDSSYNDYAKDELENNKAISYGLGWADVGTYALYDYCKNVSDNETAKSKLKTAADRLTSNYKYSGYGSTISGSYVWGSNMVIANNGMLLLMASKILEDDSYVTYAHQQLDYLLGRNPVSYCFVTGFGSQSPTDTHHRPSQVLGEAMPGMLVGGADSNLEDPYAVAVLSDAANAKCYVDSSQSYSCNEVTIYWNSPLVYLLSSFK
jgi:endoglucanase